MDGRYAARSGTAAVGAKRGWFTVEGANRTLPLVSRIVADVVARHQELELLRRTAKTAQHDEHGASTRQADAQDLETQASLIVNGLNDLIAELERIGCDLKDLQSGMVDFPARRNGQEILLCWQPGEPEIRYWHEPHAGYAGRRPIDQACE